MNMKTKNVIMLPLLSATFLLSACTQVQEESRESKESTQSSQDSKKPDSQSSSSYDEFWGSEEKNKGTTEGADSDLSILEKTMEKTFNSNGFRMEIKPFKGAVTGVKYSQKTGKETKTSNWDALLNVADISQSTTHVGEGDKEEDYNFALQVKDADISSLQYGIGYIISNTAVGAELINSEVEEFGSDLYMNAYYSGGDYSDRLFYDIDNEEGKESENLSTLLGLAKPMIMSTLDSLGYSVYIGDNPKNDYKFDLNTKGYVELPSEEAEEETETETLEEQLPDNYQEIIMDFILSIKDEFKDNIITTKDGNTYVLSVNFQDDAKIKEAIDEYINKLDDNWSYTIPLPTEGEEGSEEIENIVITKEDLQKISEKLQEAGEIERFEYEIRYNENVLTNGALKFEMTFDKSSYDSKFEEMQPEEGENEKSMVAVTDIKINEKTEYTTYALEESDSDESKLKEHLRSFANIPSLEKLATYPKQEIPEKKQTSSESETE